MSDRTLNLENSPLGRTFQVAIMPGHGGEDSGATNPHLHALEKNYNWLEAQEIKKILEGQGNYQVTICRQESEDVPLYEFQERANATHADVCLCLHHNACNGNAKGWWLFYTQDSQANTNLVQLMDKHFHELPLQARGYDYAGKPFQQSWFSRIWNCIGKCQMPTILVETCFIDNDSDCQWLMNDGYKQVAQTICKGVKEYLTGSPEPYTVFVNDANPPLNVRSGPGTSHLVVGQLANGTALTVVESNQEGWLRISQPVAGWVAAYLTKKSI